MTVILRLACLSCLASMLGFAGNLSGWLVDSECYASLENNQRHPPSFVDWDRDRAIRYCSASNHTKSFAVVRQDGLSFNFDPAGNEKANHLGLNGHSNSLYKVNLTGQMSGNTVKVGLISITERVKH